MNRTDRILDIESKLPALKCCLATLVAMALWGCGQPGALYLPTEAAAAKRATLPQIMFPNSQSPANLPNNTSPTPARVVPGPSPSPSP